MFSFFQKKARLKAALFASSVPILIAGLLIVACSGPDDINLLVNAQQPNITAQPAGATWNVNTVPAALSSINPKVTAASPDGGSLTYQWYWNTTNSTGATTNLISGQTSATLNLTSIRSSELSRGNGVRYFYVRVTNTIAENGDGGNKTATATSNAAAITIQGIVPFAPLANWTAGRHDPGSANFESIMQAAVGYYPSSGGDEYLIRRYGDLSSTEKTRLGITATTTVNGTAVQNNDYIYAYAFPDMMFMDNAYFYGVIRAINIFSQAGANNSDWRGIFVVEFMKRDEWGSAPPANSRYHGYYFGFFSQDVISSMCNMKPSFSYTDTIDGVITAFNWADRASIIGGLGGPNLYNGGWNRQPTPWPTN